MAHGKSETQGFFVAFGGSNAVEPKSSLMAAILFHCRRPRAICSSLNFPEQSNSPSRHAADPEVLQITLDNAFIARLIRAAEHRLEEKST